MDFPTLIEKRTHALGLPETKIGSISTRSVPAHHQFELWRTTIAASAGTVGRDEASHLPFDASLDNYLTSTFGYARHSVGHEGTLQRDKRAIALGDFDGIGIQLRLKGHELLNDFGHGDLFGPGQIRFHDLRLPFFMRNGAYENIALVTRRDQLLERVPMLDGLHGAILPDGTMTLLLREHMKLSFQILEHASRVEAEQLSKVTLEVLAAAFLGAHYTDILASETMPRALIQAIRHCIDHNLHQPGLSPAFLARAVGVSRTKLYEACRPFGSPMEMVRARRLQRARELIQSRPQAQITEIAALVGYDNLETFSRQFRQEFSVSARDFRHACRDGGTQRP